MGEVNNEEKQNLKSIKAVFELNNNSSITNLYNDVKKARQQLANFSNVLKDKYVSIKQKKEEEEKRIEILKAKEESVRAMEEKLAEVEGKSVPKEPEVIKPQPKVSEAAPVKEKETIAEKVELRLKKKLLSKNHRIIL